MTRSFPKAAWTAAALLLGAASDVPGYEQPPDAFLAVKGERALVMGYADGLEAWAYPLQLFSGYRVRFHVEGRVEPYDGRLLLKRVERYAAETVRVYVGPDFVVRERIFVPRRRAGAIIRYEVEGRPALRIEVAFRPSLDLMWPGALGGQSVGWSDVLSGYVEREPLHGFSAAIVSTEATAHDDTANRTRPVSEDVRMVLTPRGAADRTGSASVVIGLDAKGAEGGTAGRLRGEEAALRRDAAEHAAEVLGGSLRIVTPDDAVNRALGSAALALDRAWVCGDALGCGAVAGYGPSRRGRRPQYAWFFAGDGLVAMQGMLAAGQHERARAELDFIARYQDRKTGMIWHEMSQSAPLIGWKKNYHYMYVHVDITPQYLAALEDYAATTGDRAFVRERWAGIAAAWRYARSIVDPASGMPRIPEGKQGQNEQDALRDDIRLTSTWIDGADGFARLARRIGKNGAAAEAERAAARARTAVATTGWDASRDFWLSGHGRDGAPVYAERPDASAVLTQGVFPDERVARVLDRLSAPDFLTDWGVRSLSARDPAYDPNPYASGSVWALGTSSVLTTFYKRHRALAAWPIWRGLAGWNTLDSAGHLHELLAGDLFHAERESVPEQTWSSAGLLLSAVRGLFGLEVRGGERVLRLTPHLPAGWDRVELNGVRVGADRVDLTMTRTDRGLTLSVANVGAPVLIEFSPALPLGARPVAARLDRVPLAFAQERHDTDAHAALRFTAAAGRTAVELDHDGGVEIEPVARPLREGDRSRDPKLVGARVDGDILTLDAWISPDGGAFDLGGARRPVAVAVEGAVLRDLGGGRSRIVLAGAASKEPRRAAISVRLAARP